MYLVIDLVIDLVIYILLCYAVASYWGSKGYNSRSGWTESFLLSPLVGFIIGVCLRNMSAGRTETDEQCTKRYNATINKVLVGAFAVTVLILLVS